MSKTSVPAVQPPPQDWEQTLEQTEQQVIDGKIDTIDTEARYLGMLAFFHFLPSAALLSLSLATPKEQSRRNEMIHFD